MELFKNIKNIFSAKQKVPVDYKIVSLHSVDSTNTYLRTYLPEEGEKITLVVADYQTAGRGQGLNKWKELAFFCIGTPITCSSSSTVSFSRSRSFSIERGY